MMLMPASNFGTFHYQIMTRVCAFKRPFSGDGHIANNHRQICIQSSLVLISFLKNPWAYSAISSFD